MSVVASVAGSTVADMSESDMHLLNPAPFGRILPAMITPMKPNGDVDFEAAQKLAKQLVADGADGLVVAVGRAKMVNEEYIKDGAVVIDVGMDRDENGKLCGDVDFDSACKKASYITPVPGGVGPMTIATLMKNAVTAAIRQSEN